MLGAGHRRNRARAANTASPTRRCTPGQPWAQSAQDPELLAPLQNGVTFNVINGNSTGSLRTEDLPPHRCAASTNLAVNINVRFTPGGQPEFCPGPDPSCPLLAPPYSEVDVNLPAGEPPPPYSTLDRILAEEEIQESVEPIEVPAGDTNSVSRRLSTVDSEGAVGWNDGATRDDSRKGSLSQGSNNTPSSIGSPVRTPDSPVSGQAQIPGTVLPSLRNSSNPTTRLASPVARSSHAADNSESCTEAQPFLSNLTL